MAISAKFLADFEQFVASTKNAEGSLKSLENQGTKLGATFESVTNIASTMASTFGIAFSVGALVSFTKSIVSAADELTKLHDKTGISVEGLQRFQVAGDDAGNTIDELTRAITKMEDKLVSGDKSAGGALEKLGLSFAALKGLAPEDQFLAISDAIRQIKDPAQQVNIAIDLFGKAGAEILPTLKRGFDDVRNSSVGMSAATVKTLDDLGDALSHAARDFKNFAGNILANVINPFGEMADAEEKARAAAERMRPTLEALVPPGLPDDLKEINAAYDEQDRVAKKNAETIKELQKNWDAALKALEPYNAAWTELSDLMAGSADLSSVVDRDTRALIEDYLKAGASVDQLVKAKLAEKGVVEAVKIAYEAHNKLLADQKKQADEVTASQDRLTFAAGGWERVLRTVSGVMQSHIEDALKLGLSHKDIALALGVTEKQVDAVAKSLAQTDAAMQKSTKATSDLASMVHTLAGEYISAAEAKRRLDQGFAFDVTSSNFAQTLAGLGVPGVGGNAEALAREGYSLQEIVAILRGGPKGSPHGPRIPGFAGGVLNAPGGWATVGERGPETMYVPPGSNIYPAGSDREQGFVDEANRAQDALVSASRAFADASRATAFNVEEFARAENALTNASDAFEAAMKRWDVFDPPGNRSSSSGGGSGNALFDRLNEQQAALYRAGDTGSPEYLAILDQMDALNVPGYGGPRLKGAAANALMKPVQNMNLTVNIDSRGAIFRDRESLRQLAKDVGDELMRNANTRRQFGAA